jgi:hypothetical protein
MSMEPQSEINPPPSTLSFRDLQTQVMNPELNPSTRTAYLEERGIRVKEITLRDPGLSSWLEGQIVNTLRAGNWNHGPENLAKSSRTIAQEAQDRQLDNATGIVLLNQRYDGLIQTVISTTAEIAQLQRDIPNVKEPEAKHNMEVRKKRLESRTVATQFGIVMDGGRVAHEMGVLKSAETKAKQQMELRKQQEKQQEREDAKERQKKEAEDTKKKEEEAIHNMTFTDLTSRILDQTPEAMRMRSTYITERARRVLELQTADPSFVNWLGLQTEEILKESGWVDAPHDLFNANPILTAKAEVSHPKISEPRFKGIVGITLGGLSREAHALTMLRDTSLTPDRRRKWEQERDIAMLAQPIDIEVDLEKIMQEGEQRKRQKIQQQSSQPQQTPLTASEIAKAVQIGTAAGLREGRLTSDESYRQFQNDERRCNTPIGFNKNAPPSFWSELQEGERRQIELRAELAQAVYIKRKVGGSLDALANHEAMKDAFVGLTKQETAELCSIPGVEQALQLYVNLIDNSQNKKYKLERANNTEYSLFQCQDFNDVNRFRNEISGAHFESDGRQRKIVVDRKIFNVQNNDFPNSVYSSLYQGFRADGVDHQNAQEMATVFAIDAEQIAFNLLYLGNTFESTDSNWQMDSSGSMFRTKEPTLNQSDLLQPGLKNNMKPLDAAVERYKKDRGDFKPVGALSPWAFNNLKGATERAGVTKIDVVQVVPYIPGAEKDWWKIVQEPTSDGTSVRAYVPDYYPIQTVASFWEETKIKDGDDEKSLISFLRNKEKIPWESPGAATPWSDYMDKLRAAGTVWTYLNGEKKLQFTQLGTSAEWTGKIDKALVDLKRSSDINLKRWILYASVGIDPNKQLPEIFWHRDQKEVAKKNLDEYSNYMPSSDIFFDWDKLGWISKIA